MVQAQIRKIYLKVYYNALTLDAATISSNVGATDSVLINAAGTQLYTSDSVQRTISTVTAAPAGVGVAAPAAPSSTTCC